MKVGNGADDGVTQGPLIDMQGLKVERHVGDAVAKGAKVEIGGGRHELGETFPADRADGHDHRYDGLLRRNICPVAPLFKFETGRMVAMANDTILGWRGISLPRIWRSGVWRKP